MAKKTGISISDFLRDNLQNRLCFLYGIQNIESLPIPDDVVSALSAGKPLRPYQLSAIRHFITYHENVFNQKPDREHVLFHMATGSGKTLIMAALMIYLYRQGYRNFLFFVSGTNVVEKTRDNFFNRNSDKYLFSQDITVDGKRVRITETNNFQGEANDTLRFRLTTIQALHSDLNTVKEGGVSYSDFSDQPVVIISDEAHHMNSAAKKGINSTEAALQNQDSSSDWESTAMRIFTANPANILLEFTATEDFADPAIAAKYRDKVIFDYPLRKFREDGYSKNIHLMQTDSDPFHRALSAVILSQYRLKLFESIKCNIKPVVMMKSNTIKANTEFFSTFVSGLRHLDEARIEFLRSTARGDLKAAFDYFEEKGITVENLILELKDAFKEENLLLVDGNNISPQKQVILNSLESRDNEIRAVFAVNMLNEGWDVLNLYDIVRLYDTRDAKNNLPGKTTNAEAQLIGRGARYIPFSLPEKYDPQMSLPADMRKFDHNRSHRLNILETLLYHTAYNSRYIDEINTALTLSGILPESGEEVCERIKEDFKTTALYSSGKVWCNTRLSQSGIGISGRLPDTVLCKEYTVRLPGYSMTQHEAGKAPEAAIHFNYMKVRFRDFGRHILMAALNRFPSFSFRSLQKSLPGLTSMKDFISNPEYLGNISINIIGSASNLGDLSRREMLFTATEVLRQIEPMLSSSVCEVSGSEEFKEVSFRDVFGDHTFRVAPGSPDKEEGKSMKFSADPTLRIDLADNPWYVYDDNFGTSEEKKFIRYLSGRINDISKRYDDIFLVRNYKEVKIYDFSSGRAFEPDFILFMNRKDDDGSKSPIRIFIEPKGSHLIAHDRWKEDLLLSLNQRAHAIGCEIHGLPFYNSSHQAAFEEAFNKMLGL